MADIVQIADKISLSIGLTTALNRMAWSIEGIQPEYSQAFNSVLAVGEVLENTLNSLYAGIQEDL